MTNIEFANSLRLIADFYEENQDMTVPCVQEFTVYISNSDKLVELTHILARHGLARKVADDYSYKVRRAFGELAIELYASRSNVCSIAEYVEETKEVPVQINKVDPVYEMQVQTVRVPVWKCPDSLLAKALDDGGDTTEPDQPALDAIQDKENTDVPF